MLSVSFQKNLHFLNDHRLFLYASFFSYIQFFFRKISFFFGPQIRFCVVEHALNSENCYVCIVVDDKEGIYEEYSIFQIIHWKLDLSFYVSFSVMLMSEFAQFLERFLTAFVCFVYFLFVIGILDPVNLWKLLFQKYQFNWKWKVVGQILSLITFLDSTNLCKLFPKG